MLSWLRLRRRLILRILNVQINVVALLLTVDGWTL